MPSLYLSRLSFENRQILEKKLWELQNHNCFICGQYIDLTLHQSDIDHIEPIKIGGKDDESNFALTHSSCNRSKQASHLRVARLLSEFSKIREECLSENRGPNLSDVLSKFGGSKYEITTKINDQVIEYSFPETGDNRVYQASIYEDDISVDSGENCHLFRK